jgi:hypothetical protein
MNKVNCGNDFLNIIHDPSIDPNSSPSFFPIHIRAWRAWRNLNICDCQSLLPQGLTFDEEVDSMFSGVKKKVSSRDFPSVSDHRCAYRPFLKPPPTSAFLHANVDDRKDIVVGNVM